MYKKDSPITRLLSLGLGCVIGNSVSCFRNRRGFCLCNFLERAKTKRFNVTCFNGFRLFSLSTLINIASLIFFSSCHYATLNGASHCHGFVVVEPTYAQYISLHVVQSSYFKEAFKEVGVDPSGFKQWDRGGSVMAVEDVYLNGGKYWKYLLKMGWNWR